MGMSPEEVDMWGRLTPDEKREYKKENPVEIETKFLSEEIVDEGKS